MMENSFQMCRKSSLGMKRRIRGFWFLENYSMMDIQFAFKNLVRDLVRWQRSMRGNVEGSRKFLGGFSIES